MDSHAFSEPISVPGTDTPTWEVEVIRLKGNVIVGQLLIDKNSLPPRKGRKKTIVWQLPADTSQTPRFGEHEKKRLWEMFKEQKKERRRQSRQQQREAEAADAGDPSRALNDGPGSLEIQPQDAEEEEEEEPEIIELEGPRRIEVVQEKVSDEKTAEDTASNYHSASPSSCADIRHEDSQGYQNASFTPNGCAVVSPVAPVSPPTTATKSISSSQPPPPPGFSPTIDSQPSNSSSAQPERQRSPIIPSGSLSTEVYFVRPEDASDWSLGTAVVHTFVATIGHGSIAPWLAHYSATAAKSVLVGAAQVTVATETSRSEQWGSIVRQGASAWDVTGWTSHETPHSTAAVPVVLTGTTSQATGSFVFTLSLILAPDYSNGSQEPRYCITNDILTLFKV